MDSFELKNLSDKELENLLKNQFKVLQLISSSEYGFERLSKRTLESFQNEALDIILLIRKEQKRRENEKSK